jgi:hypothetical protein
VQGTAAPCKKEKNGEIGGWGDGDTGREDKNIRSWEDEKMRKNGEYKAVEGYGDRETRKRNRKMGRLGDRETGSTEPLGNGEMGR